MVFSTNKEKGNSGLVTAIAYYGLKGYTVSIPLNDTQDYDIIVDNGQKLLKIQVKATSQRTPQGYTTFNVASTGGTKGEVYKTIKDTDIDYVFVVTELQELYEIPISEIQTTKSFNLGPDRQIFRVDNIETEYILKKSENFKQQKFCIQCGSPIGDRNNTGLCIKCANKHRQVTERPSKEQLLLEIKSLGFSATGRKYNVSDNAIRKWCDAYGLPRTIKEIKQYNI